MTDISAARYEQVLRDLVRAQERYTDLILRARCAPQFKRVAHTLAPNSPLNRISGRDGDGCIAGIQYCRVTPEGDVTACPYIAVPEGNIREQPFLAIWDHAPGFQRLRAPVLHGKCGACEYQALCGGCRARGLAHDGDLMAPDPFCGYLPQGGATIVPLREQEAGGIGWSDAALQRLSRMPGFLRGLVRQRAEAYVVERGETTVTAEHLSVLAARRFGAGGPPGRPERPIG